MAVSRSDFYDRAHELANQIAQLFLDAARWNDAHRNEAPIDPDPDGRLQRLYDGLVGFLRTEPNQPMRMLMPLVASSQHWPQVCRVCGCTDLDCSGCIERTGEPCCWRPDLKNDEGPICSACVPAVEKKP